MSSSAIPSSEVTRFLIPRHGDSANMGKINGRGRDTLLTPKGEKEAENLGRYINTNFPIVSSTVITSNLRRAIDTGKIAFKGEDITFLSFDGLNEIDHGCSEGVLTGEERNKIWKQYVAKRVACCPEVSKDPEFKWKITPFWGAETFEKLQDRVEKTLLELAKTFPGQTIVVVAHNAVIHSIVLRSLQRQQKLEMGPDGFYPMFFEKQHLPTGGESPLLPNGSMVEFECNASLDAGKDRIKFVRYIDTAPPEGEKKDEKK